MKIIADIYPTIECVECGESHRAHYDPFTRKRMVDRSLCFHCMYWSDMVHIRSSCDSNGFYSVEKKYVIRVSNVREYKLMHYTFYDKAVGGGYGGALFHILLSDGTPTWSRNVWSQGPVPERFHERLPANAILITKAQYESLIADKSLQVPSTFEEMVKAYG